MRLYFGSIAFLSIPIAVIILLITKNKKIINITLEVKCDNYKAINLYQKYNFEKQAVRKKYYNCIDGILMELKIN